MFKSIRKGRRRGRTQVVEMEAIPADTYAQRFGRAIRAARLEKNLTIHDMARRINMLIKRSAAAQSAGLGLVSSQSVSHWEFGRHRVTLDKLPYIAAALGMSLHELMPER